MHPVHPHLLERGGPFERLVGRLADHCRRVGLDARLRRALLTLASIRDRSRPLEGWEGVAGAIAAEAAYRLVRARLDAPPRRRLRPNRRNPLVR